ncbi:Oxidoreductase, molybdopterin-binding domain-containing protein [Halteromyces radiatus]|uniref:Oxidoreductase, molybdopterin-binding domain-containing protein n=1 Tax=Halteromyces radiatus TaxID=101107 RepID=UPI00221EE49E|nr:Oxidoreductase, molybdopterin-binding domain-containing protein [Halteromyces radiatus]KAI8079952.1 Oxidoreductase, molybdopterin-binding domain-containing protein [Halteromyces radiatus]
MKMDSPSSTTSSTKMLIDPRDLNTPDHFVSRDPSMIRLTGKHPFNAEPPLKSLEDSGFVTPNHLHFVRNHGPVPECAWDTHRINIVGLVHKSITLTMDDILTLPIQTIPITMACAGNRRKEQNMFKQSIGFGWGAAGVSTAYWTGVYLRDVINHFAGGLQSACKFICFEGSDQTQKGPYGTSISAHRAMSDNFDVLLAFKMNGEVLPPDHGYPIRLIVPGCIGGRSVKWLRTIECSDQPSTNIFHDNDNKVFPPQVESAEQASAENWWPRPEYTLYDLNINSVITTPQHGQRINIIDHLQTKFTVKGYAYSGGNKRITRVEISLNNGDSWLLTDVTTRHQAQQQDIMIKEQRSNQKNTSHHWTWILWQIEIDVADLVQSNDIVVRAYDESLNTQPEAMTWNLMGMMNNCWFRVKLNVVCEPTTLVIECEHPTLAGPESGGWMEKKRKALDLSLTMESPNTIKKEQPILPIFTLAEVELHQSEEDCWIIVHDLVYDCTPFLKDHPGGASSILITAGTDTTEEFDAIHSSKAQDMLQDYLIGRLDVSDTDAQSVTSTAMQSATSSNSLSNSIKASDDPFLNPRQWKDLILEKKTMLSTTIRIYRFSFPPQPFGLPIGQHVYLKLPEEELEQDTSNKNKKTKSVMRAYTPSQVGSGWVEFVIKVYFPDHLQFGGKFTQLLDRVRIGESVPCKGPLGEYEYLGNGNYSLPHQPQLHARHIAMVAGGTGITPMWQILTAALQDSEPPFISLIYCARYLDDLVLSNELDEIQKTLGSNQFHIRYILSKPPTDWKHGRGRLTKQEMKDHLFPFTNMDQADNLNNSSVLLCGSDAMIEDCCKPLIRQCLGDLYVENHVFVF